VELWFIKFGVVVLVVSCNIMGMQLVTSVSAILTIVVLLPFFLEVIYIHEYDIQWDVLGKTVDNPDWSLFLSVMLWNYTGWDSLGTLGGEIKQGRCVMPLGICSALILITINFFFPIFIGLLAAPDLDKWEVGYLEDIAMDFAYWLGVWVLLGAMISNVGQYMTTLSTSARSLWSMSKSEGDLGTKHRIDQMVPFFFGFETPFIKTPWFSTLFLGATTCVLMSFDFSLLVKCDVFLNNIVLMFEFFTFLFLRLSEPNADRPFKVPGGWFGALSITIPKLYLVVWAMVTSDWLTAVISFSVVAVIIVAYVLRKIGFWLLARYCGGSVKYYSIQTTTLLEDYC